MTTAKRLALIAAGYAVSACVGVAAVAINELRHRRSLALTFRTGGMPLFIHWRLPRAATTGHRSLSRATRFAGSGRRWRRRWCGRRRRAPRATGSACATPRRRASVALSLYPLAQPRTERRAERHPRSAPGEARAVLSYAVWESMAAGCCA